MKNVALADRKTIHTEYDAKAAPGLLLMILFSLLLLAFLGLFIFGIVIVAPLDDGVPEAALLLPSGIGIAFIVLGGLFAFIIMPFLLVGLKVVKPNEARVLTLFGRYIGTLRKDGIFWVNPFVTAVPVPKPHEAQAVVTVSEKSKGSSQTSLNMPSTKLSLKTMTLASEKQKINDLLGNPIIISIIVIWRVVDTAKAIFDVDNYHEFLSVQSDSALRNIIRVYPYDSTDYASGQEKSLRGSSQEIAQKLQEEIQEKVAVAGLEIMEARITHLAYAPEIASAMLQRQQASAIVDARTLIVEGAVGMVEMALTKLSEQEIVELDEERKAAMVSNLLVVLCSNKDAQPVVNSGTLY